MFTMDYDGVSYQGSSVTPNTWYHIEVVRPLGVASGSRMFVNGVAVAISQTTSDYSGSAAVQAEPLTVGSNLTGDGDFFSGIVDDLRMYVMGTNAASYNYGAYNYLTDNLYVASPITGIKGVAGDVNNSGGIDAGDRTAFIAGWMKKKVLNGVQIGDMATRAQGDLNLDGITDIHDLVLIQNALSGAGLGAITAAELGGVPEPGTLLLAFVASLPLIGRHRRRS
jgi:hypothetical protein